MSANKIDLEYTIDGKIFQVGQHYYVVSSPPAQSQGLTLVVHNQSGDWVDVNVDRSIDDDGFCPGVASTGHVANGSDGGYSEQLSIYIHDLDNKVTRWRPGFAGVPGNGGGEVHFRIPKGAESVFLELTVVG